MALRRYEGPAQIFFGSTMMAEAKSVSVSIRGNNQKVFTMRGGRSALSGRSRGAAECELKVENAVPVAGYEVDAHDHCLRNSDVRIVIVGGGKRRTYEGWIEDTDEGRGTDKDATISFTMVSGPPITSGA